MRRVEGVIIYSPTDLVRFLDSPWAVWMDRLYLDRPPGLKPDPEDPLMSVLAKRGLEHEARFVEQLRREGRPLVSLTREDSPDTTRHHLGAGHGVIFQAHLRHAEFAGFPDFLVWDDATRAWQIWDTKLSQHVKTSHLIQLCCYADMLAAMTGEVVHELSVVLGNGQRVSFRTAEYIACYNRLKRRFLDQMSSFNSSDAPEPDPFLDHGRWASHAEAQLAAMDHLAGIANVTRAQVLKLEAAGIRSIADLMKSRRKQVPGLTAAVVQSLRQQATLQRQPRADDVPPYLVLDPPKDRPHLGLAALPPRSALDLYFDMEGFPHHEGYLEYLFGAVTAPRERATFHDWWAHDATSERIAFESFVRFAHARWLKDRSMHVYHYGGYELTALRRLMGQHGTCEKEVDELLRHGVFVDLHEIVRRSLRIGEPRYSLKNVEKLYMRRAGHVATAVDSVVVYDHWTESGEPADWRLSPLLRSIRDYNEADCVSTWKLALWLRERQQEAEIQWAGAEDTGGDAAQAAATPDTRRAELVALLTDTSRPEAKRLDAETLRIRQLVAALLEFHRRERKPSWWMFFDRQTRTAEELKDDPDCLGDLELDRELHAEKRSRRFRYRFDPLQECRFGTGQSVWFVPDLRIKATIDLMDPSGRVELKIGAAQLAKEGLQSLPMKTSLIPANDIPDKQLEDAVLRCVDRWVGGNDLPPALEQFLRRLPPVVRGRKSTGVLRRAGESASDAVVRLVAGLNRSCLCVQGPPGTGKTFAAAQAICGLLAAGRRVGVTANSHKAINNLLKAIVEAGVDEVRVMKAGGDEEDVLLAPHPGVARMPNPDAATVFTDGVIGGTAWLFAREDMEDRLDYLFVDEAGQFSTANLVAVSAAADNLVLLGDQMQLRQPVQGAHPGESGMSALQYYLQDAPVIPAHRGVFLDESRRLHPGICAVVSELFYERRLLSHPGTALRHLRSPGTVPSVKFVLPSAGIVMIPVEHEGNAQSSPEEAELAGEVLQTLLHRGRLVDGSSERRLGLDDVLFVAPYNLQVQLLRQHLPEGARVGSVDLFQGQEAAVVVISLASSPGEFGPRGMEFVLDRNRLNVAVSRARCLAIIIGDPRLADSVPGTVTDMARLNVIARLADGVW